MAPKKKHPSVRARRNTASTAATLVDGSAVICPELPQRFDAEGDPTEWNENTLDWWADLWAAPMAAEYHSSDRHALYLLAVLVDQFWINPTKDMAGEIRLQRQAFGLTPYDRRRLEWTIETAEESKERGKSRTARTATAPPKAANDPRLALVQ